jgi:hypothetical protein
VDVELYASIAPVCNHQLDVRPMIWSPSRLLCLLEGVRRDHRNVHFRLVTWLEKVGVQGSLETRVAFGLSLVEEFES